MAIRRISDLSSILLYKKDDTFHSYTITEGITRDVLGGYESRRAGGTETDQLRNSMMEISWRREDDHTKYDSKSMSYETLSAYITHNIQCEDYDFYGNKSLKGDLNITGNVDITGDLFKVNSTSAIISGDVVHVEGNKTYIYGHDFINLSVITEPGEEEPTIGLSGDNIALHGKKTLNLIYDTTMEISWRNTKTNEIIPVMVFGNDGIKPTVTLNTSAPVGTEGNPMFGTMQYARWA